MKSFLLLLLFILNSLPVIELLTISQTDSYFNLYNKQKNNKICTQQLDNMAIELSNFPSTAIVVTDASIKNNIAISISHIHTHNNSITKTIYHVVHVTSTKVELFTIRCSINQALNHDVISKIIIVTDSIHAAKKSLTLLHIPSKFTLWLYLVNFKNFSYDTKTILSNFGNVPVVLISLSIKWSTKKQRPSILFHYFLAKHHGTLARKAKVMIY